MGKMILWLMTGCVAILTTTLVAMPASWLANGVRQQSGGRILLLNPQGTLWDGDATLALSFGGQEASSALSLPGRLNWQLNGFALLGGKVSLNVRHDKAIRGSDGQLGSPVTVSGSFLKENGVRQFTVTDGTLLIPASWLVGFGAPFNTLKPSGDLQWQWQNLKLSVGRQFAWLGKSQLKIKHFSSRVSTIKPLGDYTINFIPESSGQTNLRFVTDKGPLMIQGQGFVDKATGFKFEGRAYATPEYKERLQGLVNMLGRNQADGSVRLVF